MQLPMRLSRLLKLSFVGTLLFSPTMAQEASKVHEDALKVLRSGAADTGRSSAPAAPSGRETRAERDARLRMEAQQRLAERERIQAEKRRQFEEYVKERERLRSGASAGTVQDQAVKVLRQQTDPNAAPSVSPAPAAATPATRPAPSVQPPITPAPAAPVAPVAPNTRPTPPQTSNDDVQQRALDIIREQREQPAAAAVPIRESELAPRVTATPAPTPRSTTSPAGNTADTHQKALEVLRQQQSQPATSGTATAAPTTSREDDLKPSPELQRRLDEMQRELNTPAPRSSAHSQSNADYTRELEQRALQSLQQRSAPATAPATSVAPATAVTRTAPVAPATTAPAIDNNTREMLRRQDEQLRRQSSGVAGAASSRVTPPPARSNAIDPAAEQRARDILRQQQQAVGNASAAIAAPDRAAQTAQPPVRSTPPAVATTPRSTSTPPPAQSTAQPSVSTSSAPGDQYSRELEERARQSILARTQEQDPSAQQVQAQTAARTAAVNPLTAPVTPNPDIDRVHSRAYETLVQVQPGESGKVQFKNKQERLRALTDLYKADRLTPAEYHQRRAAILAEKEQQ